MRLGLWRLDTLPEKPACKSSFKSVFTLVYRGKELATRGSTIRET